MLLQFNWDWLCLFTAQMTNEANIFYKPLRRVSFCSCESTNPKKECNANDASDMAVIRVETDEPAKLSRSPRLKVIISKNKLRNQRRVFSIAEENVEITNDSHIFQKWVTAVGKQQSSKLQRQNSMVNDFVANLRPSSARGSVSGDSNDYGVCLLVDSPYRILRVSSYVTFFSRAIIMSRYQTKFYSVHSLWIDFCKPQRKVCFEENTFVMWKWTRIKQRPHWLFTFAKNFTDALHQLQSILVWRECNYL